MKTNRPKKRPPRLSTRILLAVIAAALVINGYCAWQILGKPLQTEQTQTAADVSSEEQELLEALGHLLPEERLLFYRKYYYLQSTAQIAAEMGMTERAVEGKLYRLKRRLRKLLGGEQDG